MRMSEVHNSGAHGREIPDGSARSEDLTSTDNAEGWYRRGMSLRQQRRLDEAIASLNRAITRKADYAQAFMGRGVVLQELKRFEEALESYDKAIAIKHDYAAAFSNRGILLKEQNRLEEALASYDQAIAIDAGSAETYNNRGNVLIELKRLDEAIASYDKAIALKPNFADAFKNRAQFNLLTGNYEAGWQDYEWRFDAKSFPDKRPMFTAPIWNGEDLTGRGLVVYGEQGFGDTFQFARYLPLLVRRHAQVTFVTDGKLVRLLRSLPEIVRLIDGMGQRALAQHSRSAGDRLPETVLRDDERFDFQCALMGLPRRFRTDLSSIPKEVPYLHAEDALVLSWKKRIGSHGFKVGIAWQGTPIGRIDRGRSIPLEEFLPLGRLPGVRLISLQKYHGLDQLALCAPIETLGAGFDDGPDGFIDTAAVMANLDLIVTSDTSIAHLAGAMGRPVWVALKHVPDWRWMLEREDSPWYATMRLFRQKTAGDWKAVFARIENALRTIALGDDPRRFA